MFGNMQYNNSNNERNITTRVKTLFGDISSFQIAYWNENLSVKINPLLGVTPDGIRQYDYNRRCITAINPDKCTALAEAINDKIMPLLNNKEIPTEPISLMVQVGKSGFVVGVEYVPNAETGTADLYFVMVPGAAPGMEPEVIKYKFSKMDVMVNYNTSTGESESTITYEAEFLYFYDKLKRVTTIIGGAAHSVNYESAFKKNGYGDSGFNSFQSLSPHSTPASQPSMSASILDTSSGSAPVNQTNLESLFS